MTTETKPTDFGTSEDSRTVAAAKLELGVRLSGFDVGDSSTVVVQNVETVHTGRDARRIKVEVANFNNGDVYTRYFRPDKPVTTWGKI
jgi:translation elongation factor P/translation initiation factor 5A